MIDDVSLPENIYLNVVARINEDYEELLVHLKQLDLRCCYLKSFEISLSSALSEKPLWEMNEYQKHKKECAMPSDPYEFLTYEEFRGWLEVYETVMRASGLIGTKEPKILCQTRV